MTEKTRFRAVVYGRVQGVNFRYYTQLRARQLGVSGYVRNRWDGTVEVVAEGERSTVDRLLEFLHEGPPAAWVQRVDVEWQEYAGKFDRFDVRY